jgi:hypothetical protein
MRKLLLPFCFVTVAASAQQTIHSAMNGAASSPLTWDCFCFPTPDDVVIIDHNVTMDVDWAVTSGGRIEVSPGASLLEDADRQLLIDGTGSQLINGGAIDFTDIAFTNGSEGSNSGQFTVGTALYFGGGTTFLNTGGINGSDSVLTEGTFTNSGFFTVGDFYNTGDFTNTGYLVADSMGNGGTFEANANYLLVGTFGNFGTFTLSNEGFMEVEGDFLNTNDFTIASGLQVFVGGNAWNGDTLGGAAEMLVDGALVVNGDYGNGDLTHGSGDICVGGGSINVGQMTGSVDFCDATGSDFDQQFGTVGMNVTFCTDGCNLETAEEATVTAELYPIPATTHLEIKSNAQFTRATFYSLMGELVGTVDLDDNTIALDGLGAGIYLVQLSGETTTRLFKVVIE